LTVLPQAEAKEIIRNMLSIRGLRLR